MVNTLTKIILDTITGLILAIAVLIFVIVASAAVAFSAKTTTFIPGLLRAWPTGENNALEFNLETNNVGMLVFVVIVTLLYVAAKQIRKKAAENRKSRA